jgi:hypothetical protein
MFMKRPGSVFGLVLLGSMVAGCGDSGVEVGGPKEVPTTTQTEQFKNYMKKAGPNMTKSAAEWRKSAASKAKKASPTSGETKDSS